MTEAEDHGTRGTMTDDAAVCIANREDGIDFPTSAEDDGMGGMDDSISVVPLGRITASAQ